MLEFQNIEFLLGLAVLIPLAFLFFFVLRWKAKTRKLLGDPRLVEQLTQNYSEKKYRLKIILILSAIALSILALANLRKPQAAKGTRSAGIDVMVALDVSRSMLSQDEKPTRLDKAKQFINQLNDKLQGNRIGLVVFAGRSYLQMPLTSDAGAAKMFVSNASPDIVTVQGTVLSDALNLCNTSLDTKEKKSKAIILITDGEDHDDKALEITKQLAEQGTVVHTIGVGSITGSPILDPVTNEYKRDENGETIISKLNETLLKQLAETAHGTYHQLTNTNAIAEDVYASLNSMEKKAIAGNNTATEYYSFFPLLLAMAVALLIAEVFISERKKKIKIA